jgi:hypothetical protein
MNGLTVVYWFLEGIGLWLYAVFPNSGILQVPHYLENTVVALETCAKTDH